GRVYTLMTATGGISVGSGGFNFGGGATSITVGGAPLTLSQTGNTALLLTVGTLLDAPSDLYWRGGIDNTWSTLSGINTNWNTDAGPADTNAQAVPGAATNVHFYNSNTAAGAITTNLGQSFTINSLL